eukprot:Rmarinus@m.23543
MLHLRKHFDLTLPVNRAASSWALHPRKPHIIAGVGSSLVALHLETGMLVWRVDVRRKIEHVVMLPNHNGIGVFLEDDRLCVVDAERAVVRSVCSLTYKGKSDKRKIIKVAAASTRPTFFYSRAGSSSVYGIEVHLGKQMESFKIQFQKPLTSMICTPAGPYLLVGLANGSLHSFNCHLKTSPEQGVDEAEVKDGGASSAPHQLVIHPFGKVVVGIGATRITAWNIVTSKCLARQSVTYELTSAAFHPRVPDILYATSLTGTVRMFLLSVRETFCTVQELGAVDALRIPMDSILLIHPLSDHFVVCPQTRTCGVFKSVEQAGRNLAGAVCQRVPLPLDCLLDEPCEDGTFPAFQVTSSVLYFSDRGGRIVAYPVGAKVEGDGAISSQGENGDNEPEEWCRLAATMHRLLLPHRLEIDRSASAGIAVFDSVQRPGVVGIVGRGMRVGSILGGDANEPFIEVRDACLWPAGEHFMVPPKEGLDGLRPLPIASLSLHGDGIVIYSAFSRLRPESEDDGAHDGGSCNDDDVDCGVGMEMNSTRQPDHEWKIISRDASFQKLIRIFSGPRHMAGCLILSCTSAIGVGIVSEPKTENSEGKQTNYVKELQRGVHVTQECVVKLGPGESVLDIQWQTLPPASFEQERVFAVAAVLTSVTLRVVALVPSAPGGPPGLIEICSIQRPSVAERPTSCLWVGPSIVYTTMNDVRWLTMDGCTQILCAYSNAATGLVGHVSGVTIATVLPDRVLLVSAARACRESGIVQLPASMAPVLLSGWLAWFNSPHGVQTKGDKGTSVALPRPTNQSLATIVQCVLTRLGTKNIDASTVRKLLSVGEVAAAYAIVQNSSGIPKWLYAEAAACAHKFDEAVEVLCEEAGRKQTYAVMGDAKGYPSGWSTGCAIGGVDRTACLASLRALAKMCSDFGQFNSAAKCYAAAGDSWGLFRLCASVGDRSSLRALMEHAPHLPVSEQSGPPGGSSEIHVVGNDWSLSSLPAMLAARTVGEGPLLAPTGPRLAAASAVLPVFPPVEGLSYAGAWLPPTLPHSGAHSRRESVELLGPLGELGSSGPKKVDGTTDVVQPGVGDLLSLTLEDLSHRSSGSFSLPNSRRQSRRSIRSMASEVSESGGSRRPSLAIPGVEGDKVSAGSGWLLGEVEGRVTVESACAAILGENPPIEEGDIRVLGVDHTLLPTLPAGLTLPSLPFTSPLQPLSVSAEGDLSLSCDGGKSRIRTLGDTHESVDASLPRMVTKGRDVLADARAAMASGNSRAGSHSHFDDDARSTHSFGGFSFARSRHPRSSSGDNFDTTSEQGFSIASEGRSHSRANSISATAGAKPPAHADEDGFRDQPDLSKEYTGGWGDVGGGGDGWSSEEEVVEPKIRFQIKIRDKSESIQEAPGAVKLTTPFAMPPPAAGSSRRRTVGHTPSTSSPVHGAASPIRIEGTASGTVSASSSPSHEVMSPNAGTPTSVGLSGFPTPPPPASRRRTVQGIGLGISGTADKSGGRPIAPRTLDVVAEGDEPNDEKVRGRHMRQISWGSVSSMSSTEGASGHRPPRTPTKPPTPQFSPSSPVTDTATATPTLTQGGSVAVISPLKSAPSPVSTSTCPTLSPKHTQHPTVVEQASATFRQGLQYLEQGAFKQSLDSVLEAIDILGPAAVKEEEHGGTSGPRPVASSLRLCACYSIALRLLIQTVVPADATPDAKVTSARLSTFLATLPLRPPHRLTCIRLAASRAATVRNFSIATQWITFMLDKGGLTDASRKTAEQQLERCKQSSSIDYPELPVWMLPTDQYDSYCHKTFRHHNELDGPLVRCKLCKSCLSSSCAPEDLTCPICHVGLVQ